MALFPPPGKNDQPMDSPGSRRAAQLLPRYRRVLTFGDVLDESVRLYRQHWVSFALISAVALLPPGLVAVSLSASGAINRSISLAELQSGRLAQTAGLGAQYSAILATFLLSLLFGLAWTSAIVCTTDAYLRGEQPGLARTYARALPSYLSVLAATLLYVLGVVVTTIMGSLLFVITGFGTLGSLIALVGLLFWWLRPGARRKTWLKWLIILTAPFGLPTYFGAKWSMFVAAAVLEHLGPLAALRRSSQLVDGQWWRVTSILSVSGVIVGVLQYAPEALINIPLAVSDASRGQFGLGPTEAAVSNGLSVVLQILFASIGPLVYSVLFIDLRNRREGTDIAERLAQIEAVPLAANE